MRKLILFDIDGTIITDGNEGRIIPQSLTKTLQLLQQKGHLCFINTGRAMAEVDSAIHNLNFDGFICGCGTYIEQNHKKLYSKTFSPETASQILHDLNECHLEWILEGYSNIYYRSEPYKTRIGSFKKEHSTLVPDAVKIIDENFEDKLLFDKFCICLCEGHNFEAFQNKYKDTLTFVDRNEGFYEIMPKGCSKASGIQYLESLLSIPHEDTIAIGDSTNDLPMLEYAAYSIAMGNSSKELLPVVDYVTDTVLNDGIYKAMQHLRLI